MLRKEFNPNFISFSMIFVGFLYAGIYIALKNNSNTTAFAGYLSLVGETGLDIAAAVLTFNLWKKATLSSANNIFLFFFISFIAATFADSIYNVVLNLFQFQYINPIVVSLFDVPFAIFLLFQVITWAWILFANKEVSLKASKSSYIPYVIVSLLMFIMFMFGISWRIKYFSLVGLFQLIDTFFEVIGFALATICLARGKTRFIRFTTIGYLLIISSNFIIRYHVVSGIVPYLSSLEATWILGLLLMCLGFFLDRDNRDIKSFELLPVNSLQAQIAVWVLVLWLGSIFIFIGTYYIFSQNIDHYLNHIVKNFLSMLVPFSVLAIISSSYIATKISWPLLRLENIINQFIESETSPSQIGNEFHNNSIYEVGTLERFVFNAFHLYQRRHSFDIEFAKIATQVAHDIRSPLVVLENISKDLRKITDDQRNVILSSINSISEITENILDKHKFFNKQHQETLDLSSQNSIDMIFPLLDETISEKKAQFKDKNIKIKLMAEQSTESLFCSIKRSDFKRVISNLINNSVEAIETSGEVLVYLKRNLNNLVIEINDTGCGIPLQIIDNLNTGISYHKKSGNGLGLKHAIKCIKEWSGNYFIDPRENGGTKFSIVLNIMEPPAWITEELYFRENQKLIIVDDDRCIYDLWKEKLLKHSLYFSIENSLYFNSPETLFDHLKFKNDCEDILFLIDFHYSNSNNNGLDIIRNLTLLNNVILVTNQYPDKNTKNFLIKTGSKILFKKDVLSIPIYTVYRHPDLVLLDDKKMITKMWLREAKKYNKKIVFFNRKDLLIKNLDFFDRETIVYLDSDLNGESGIDVARELYQRKFINLYITTGHDKNQFNDIKFIKGIVGKEPPFCFVQGCTK